MTAWQDLLAVIKNAKAYQHPEKLDQNLSFRAQQIDSLDLASIFLAVEERYGIKVFAAPGGRPESFTELLNLIAAGKNA